jgi:hypothetical protein
MFDMREECLSARFVPSIYKKKRKHENKKRNNNKIYEHPY